MAASYGYDISGPPATAREAVQWLYFGYLGAVKEQNGAAMSLGRTSTFLDVYLAARPRRGPDHRDRGTGADRRLRHQAPDRAVPAHPGVRRPVLRRPDLGHRVDRRHGRGRPHAGHQARRSGSCRPSTTWARPRSRTSRCSGATTCRGVQGLLRAGLDRHSAVQYESDDLIRGHVRRRRARSPAVCRAMRVGKQMQFFGARVNLAKTLLYAINGGRDEVTRRAGRPGRRRRSPTMSSTTTT